MIRKIVTIDEERCDGCGLCIPSCAEGAITIVDGKARLAADNLCDGLGACLGECPQDAIHIIEREADEFDEAAVEKHLGGVDHNPLHKPQDQSTGGGCPGSRVVTLLPQPAGEPDSESGAKQQSRLGQWPVQLHLVPTNAPYFHNADLLIAADCVPFAYAGFHDELLAGKALVIACPKLDDNSMYLKKLTDLFRTSTINSVTVARMEVPCCAGIAQVARQALVASGRDIPFTVTTVGINGEISGKL